MSDPAAELKQIFASDPLDLGRLAALLDGLAEDTRVDLVRSLGGKEQRRMWDAAASNGSTLEDFAPKLAPAGVEVINAGKNSLPVFTHFEKRFVRVEGRDDVLYGYNESPTKGLIGPGYFVAHAYPERGEVGIDYLQVPPADARVPAGWPAIKPNESGLQRFVYAGMVDYMRRVSKHVSIGRAYKGGTKELPHTFLLIRRQIGG